MAAALTIALTGCFGTAVDPSAQFSPVDAPLGGDLADGLQGVLDQAVALSGSSGGVAGVWAPWAGEWTAASGTVDFGEKPPPMTTDTGFRLATVTTEITCTVLLRLADQGEVQLDDPVAKYVDWIPKLDGITLEQLCLHTSGLADYYPVLRPTFGANPGRVWPANELLANGMALNRIGPPGEQVRESRTGILLLALALERRTSKTWDELAQQYVLGPLGLEETSLPPGTVTEHAGVMGGYSSITVTGAVDCAVLLDDTEASSSMGGAAAGAISTLEDARSLSEAFATGALLSERTARAQWNTVPLGGDAPAWQSAGLGGAQYGPMRGTAGETAGALTAAFTDAASGLTVVVALNNSTPGPAFVREVAFALASLASKAPPAAGGEQPLIELPWSADQATAKMQELGVCPRA
ncbi:serine hydrolase domain-containing protein [Agromyces mariniharenae]|uniref:Beta-lactamase family protein n=1 Tax=Agromyces mariniharenae TaxID=2604423 RepID=A0A5S4V3N7_9MICO|nr:serine hydrolase domain-containing protein [Agromyces mariniharenae]TYL53622.1 beta-lactamase family protein [Agromyces mariniharenae]